MPCLILKDLREVGDSTTVELPYEIREKYPLVFKSVDNDVDVKARVYLEGFYSKEGVVIKEYKKPFILPVLRSATYTSTSYYLDFTRFHMQDGIPVGYYAEFLILSFIVGDDREVETPVFPNEFKPLIEYTVPNKVKERAEQKLESLKKTGREFELIGILYSVGLHHIASDLTEALTRFYVADYEGAIKFFRKIVEGLRKYVQSNKIEGMSENRKELLRSYLSKAFQLISSFGEHSGTYGSMYEAVFSKEIAVSVTRYLASYILSEKWSA